MSSSGSSFTNQVARVLSSIPSGRVVTYGQVAAMAGRRGAARQVVWVLRTLSESQGLPWHRVVNARGGISLPGEGGALQRSLLEQEGVRFDDSDRIPLAMYQWRGW